MLRWFMPVLGVVAIVAPACSGSDGASGSGGSSGSAGTGGAATGGASAARGGRSAVSGGAGPGSAGQGGNASGAAAGEGGASCALAGQGTIVVQVSGLPTGVAADIALDGPDPKSVTKTQTYTAVGAGSYSLTASRVFDADPIVRTVFEPRLTEDSFCLDSAETHTVKVVYTAIPSSNKLWTPNGPGGKAPLLGFAAADLSASGAPDANVAADGPVGNVIAFDRDGNAWSRGSTAADPALVRFPAADLGASGAKAWDAGINLPSIPCIPAIRELAFDLEGNLWVSACGGQALRVDAADLTPSSAAVDVTAAATLSGLTDNEDLAFDAAGNLWLADSGTLVRFDRARLSTSDSAAADYTIVPRDSADTQDLAANFLAFDSAGNLWGADFAGNSVFEIAKADLGHTGSRTVVAHVSIVIGVAALFNRPAFDDGGALWLSLSAGHFGALSPTQLRVSSSAGDATTPAVVLASGDVGYANDIAFFPAAVGLPLYHSLP